MHFVCIKYSGLVFLYQIYNFIKHLLAPKMKMNVFRIIIPKTLILNKYVYKIATKS